MRERDYFGEKMTDLDFRIDARLEAAKELDDIVRSDENGRIRLFRIDGAHVLYDNLPFVRKPRRRGELDSTLVGFEVCEARRFSRRRETNLASAVASSSVPSRGPRRTAASAFGFCRSRSKRVHLMVNGSK